MGIGVNTTSPTSSNVVTRGNSLAGNSGVTNVGAAVGLNSFGSALGIDAFQIQNKTGPQKNGLPSGLSQAQLDFLKQRYGNTATYTQIVDNNGPTNQWKVNGATSNGKDTLTIPQQTGAGNLTITITSPGKTPFTLPSNGIPPFGR